MKAPGNRILLRPGVVLDLALQGIWKGRHWIALPPIPFRLLEYLAQHPNQVIAEAQLLAVGWPGEGRDPEDLYHPIHFLRTVLEPDPHYPRWLITRRNVGYCWRSRHHFSRFDPQSHAP